MWAIVEIAKKQYFVERGLTFRVEKLDNEKGNITFDKILLLAGEDKVSLGSPYVTGAKVKAEIIGQEKGDKVISYKYRRRKKSRRIRGHRQIYTLLKISEIIS
ncbi:MAG: 50S ribosomal protein L21 [Candidatus Omnitrophota bacterium]|nr:50S ribosomal protein L21 [Candidatus Omnitrophota bacterium]